MARILIVDDEEVVRFTLVKALQDQHHEIYQASDGSAALNIMSEQPFDLVVTDILMPNREGLETIQEIRMNWPRVKIIAMSGGGRVRHADFLKLAQRFGADTVMRKPFSMNQFSLEVEKFFDDRALWQAE